MLEAWRIPFSTNVERVAIAAGLKGLPVRWHDVDPADRSPVVARSGQPLLPVARFEDGTVLADSPAILAEAEHPDPPLWPREPAARAQADVFVPFLRLGLGVPQDDPDPFHHVLHEQLAGMRHDARSRLRAWAELLSARLAPL